MSPKYVIPVVHNGPQYVSVLFYDSLSICSYIVPQQVVCLIVKALVVPHADLILAQ